MSFNELPGEILQEFFAHMEIPGVPVQLPFLKIIAIGTVQVTGRTCRFKHHMKGIGPAKLKCIFKKQV
jgi:hypothetical protein